MSHLPPDRIAALRDGTVSDTERVELQAHLDNCIECRVRVDESEPTTRVGGRVGIPIPGGNDTVATAQFEKRHGAEYLARGTAVGRYVVIDVLGEGGMGVVYSAFDPELDRKVAIKLMQARPAGGELSGGQAWLLREAQALARLAHPNVIAVHDVGSLPGERIFIAMELAEGVSLRRWLRHERRGWREIVRVFSAAGRGLAAAHAAGLVHRDFKPDNVLIGNDGRPRVLDFGLARMQRDPHQLAPGTSGDAREPADATGPADRELLHLSPLTATLTLAGQVMGTPAYMAPEIHDGGSADERSDQFAFGAALYEALYGVVPFPGRPLDRPSATRWRPQDPPARGASTGASTNASTHASAVPDDLGKIARRAIAEKAADRFPSMDALLQELDVDRDSRRRRVFIAAGLAAAVAVVVIGSVSFAGSRARLCSGADDKLAGAWSEATRAKIEGAFTASGKPFAAEAFNGVARSLDGYASEWKAMQVESCEATRVRGEQTEDVMSLRQICLDHRLEELGALTNVLATADVPLVEKAEKAVWSLEPIKRCADVAALQAPARQPTDPALQPKLAELRVALADAKARTAAAQFDLALPSSAKALALARELQFGIGEALLVNGALLTASAKYADAATVLQESAYAALAGHRDDVAARAALLAAENAANGLGKPDDGKLWLGLGAAATQRLGTDRWLEHRVLEVSGIVAAARRELREAAALHEQALARAQQLFGAEDARIWKSEQLLASSLAKAGEWAKAVPHYERALALKTRDGASHPDVALILSNLGACYDHVGDIAKARSSFERALAIREQVFGPESPKLTATLNNIADMVLNQGDIDQALVLARRGTAIAIAGQPGHPLNHIIRTTLGEILAAHGDVEEARALLDELLVEEEKGKSPILPTTLVARAGLARKEKKWSDAVGYDERAIAFLEGSGGKDAAELWEPLAGLAESKLALGDKKGAVPLLERALVIGEKAGQKSSDLAGARTMLAKATTP